MVFEPSHLRKTNEELKKKIKEQEMALIRAEKLAVLGQLVAGVAHEINNPATFIRGNIEIMQKYWKVIENNTKYNEIEELKPINSAMPSVLRDAYMGTEKIMKIIDSLRLFSRIEEIEMAEVDLLDCIKDSLLFVKHEFYKNQIRFVNKIKNGNIKIMASKSKMEQVFINLFLNAVHALKHLKGNKVIELGLKKKNSQSVTIFVKDNGCGISKENMRNLFTPFFTTRFSEGGSGLGLSIVYGIIHEHNGRIRARSKENSGTEFIITLPLAN